MRVVISIPAYNEELTLGKVISEIHQVMKKTKYRYEVQVVDDGSKDKTVQVAKKAGARVYSHPRNRGLAQTFQTEVAQALKHKADIMVHTDADGQYPAEYIPPLIEKVEQGYDLVLGSRFRGKIQSMPFIKRFGNMAFSQVLSALTKTRITDGQSGFRAFTAEVAREIKFINTFTYTQEQLIKAAKQKFRITEIPIYARKTRRSRLFRGPLDFALRAWINIFRIYRDYNPIKFFGGIGMFFLATSLLLGTYAIGSWILGFTESINDKIPSLLLTIVFFSTGIQIILFGFIADKIQD